jgi:thioester reductase-like protein
MTARKLTAAQLLTGATGSLGVHVLSILLARSDVDAIYCAIRGDNQPDRLRASFSKRKLEWPEHSLKIKFVPYEPGRLVDGLPEITRNDMLDTLTHIVHAAWPVNFQLPLEAFYPHLKDVRDLVQLSLDVKHQPAQLLYCSSVGVALSTIGQSRIAEAPMMDFRQAISTGYTQSKLVAEYIIQRAVEDFESSSSILRIGQIVGDTKAGIWNDDEAPPTMIRSALTLGCLPALDMVSLNKLAGSISVDSLPLDMLVDPC